MGPALPASHGPRTWDGGQVPCEGRPDTRWSGQAPSREPRGRSRFRPADCIRTEEITLDTVNLIQGVLILLYVALVPSLLSQMFYMRGVELIGPGRAGLFVNLVPIFGALLAVLLLGEPFRAYHALALALVLGGIWLAERGRG